MDRPSSPKPAFVIRTCERLPSADVPGDEVRLLGGFRLKIRLHPSEHPEHLRRSIARPYGPTARTLAVCTPDELAQLSGRVQCHLIEAARQQVLIREDDQGAYVIVESADPLGTPNGHEWQPRRKDVPNDAIWLIRVDETVPSAVSTRLSPDWRSRWQRRYRPLVAWPLLLIVPTAGLAAWVTLTARLAGLLQGEGTGFVVSAVSTLWLIVRYEVAVSVDIVVLMLAVQCVRYWRYEKRWGPSWTAGTTGCLQDALDTRNGKPPLRSSEPRSSKVRPAAAPRPAE